MKCSNEMKFVVSSFALIWIELCVCVCRCVITLAWYVHIFVGAKHRSIVELVQWIYSNQIIKSRRWLCKFIFPLFILHKFIPTDAIACNSITKWNSLWKQREIRGWSKELRKREREDRRERDWTNERIKVYALKSGKIDIVDDSLSIEMTAYSWSSEEPIHSLVAVNERCSHGWRGCNPYFFLYTQRI